MITAALKRQVTLKRIFIIAYVLSVLMIAGLARASDGVPMPVTKVEVDNANQVILVEGYRSNACQRKPKPVVENIDLRTRTIMMKIVSQENGFQFCTQKIEGNYQILVSIPNLRLPEHVPYRLVFLNSQGVTPVEVTSNGMAEGFPFSSLDLTGILIQEGRNFAIQTRSANFKVTPTLIDLTRYVGRVVDVSGHELPFGLMPVDELNTNDNGEEPKSLILTGIASGN